MGRPVKDRGVLLWALIKYWPPSGVPLTLQVLGRILRVTRERVRQLLIQYNLQDLYVEATRGQPCTRCGRRHPILIAGWCRRCAHTGPFAALLAWCGWCHKEITVPRYKYFASIRFQELRVGYTKTAWYCGRQCWGYYIATQYGIGTPNNPIDPAEIGRKYGGRSSRHWKWGLCQRGHDITKPENVYQGHRQSRCRPCHNLSLRNRYWKRKGMEPPAIKRLRRSGRRLQRTDSS